jgi:Lipase maturation factor
MDVGFVSPVLVWGLIPRFVGLLYIIAFAALAPQVALTLASGGIIPLKPRLAQIKRDYPGVRRFFDNPSVMWISTSDGFIHAMPVLGLLCGVLAVYGGPVGYAALFVAWLIWLSFEPAGLIFPWDTMLQEVGFLVLFLPLTHALPALDTSHLPLPTVAFMFRWLVLRLMLGFGKLKFIGTTKEDKLFLQGFFVWLPLPTPLAWFAFHCPRWLLQASLYFMFAAEIIAPSLGFFTGLPRLIGWAMLCMLMVGIQLTGNWGYFNLGYVLMCTCLLDVNSSIFDLKLEPWASAAMHWPDLAIHLTMALLFFVSVPYFLFNSWVTRTWVHWPWENAAWDKPLVRALIQFFRFIAPFRVANGYGVFPPYSQPPMRMVPIFEGSHDGETWKQYGYRFMPTFATSRAPFVAPHHPRLDQGLYYANACIFDGSLFGSVIGDGNPYSSYTRSSWLDRVAQKLLRGDKLFTESFAVNPFPDGPPRWIRVSTVLMTPTSLEDRRETGHWWHIKRVGTTIPARQKEDWPDQLALPLPELFHPDFIDYRRRALPLLQIGDAFKAGVDPDEAAIVGSDLTASDVAEFWNDVVPMLADARGDWTQIHVKAHALLDRYGMSHLARHERLLERFAWLLRLATERHHFADATPKIEIKSNFRYHMFLHEVVLDGREAFRQMLAQPQLAAARAATTTDASQLWALSLFRYDLMMLHLRAFRWTELGMRGHQFDGPGLFEYYPHLAAQKPPDEEFLPKPIKHPNGEYTIEGFYPPPPVSRGTVVG